MADDSAPSPRTRVKRGSKKAHYDRETLYSILDATPVAHVSYIMDGSPVVTPTMHWREGDRLYWHGSSASRMLETAPDLPVCIAVTLMDGLVLARSGFEHSLRYRSVMVFGTARLVEEPTEKARLLELMMEQMVPGRWATLRPMTVQELKATRILTISLEEASAKVSDGMPTDREEDYTVPVWAGVVPVHMAVGEPIPDPRILPGIPVPANVKAWRIG